MSSRVRVRVKVKVRHSRWKMGDQRHGVRTLPMSDVGRREMFDLGKNEEDGRRTAGRYFSR